MYPRIEETTNESVGIAYVTSRYVNLILYLVTVPVYIDGLLFVIPTSPLSDTRSSQHMICILHTPEPCFSFRRLSFLNSGGNVSTDWTEG